MSLIDKINAGFTRAAQLIKTKQDKLPINGTENQFLAWDFTFKRPLLNELVVGGMGCQLGKPVSGDYYDNAMSGDDYITTTVDTNLYTIPLLFKDDFAITEMTMDRQSDTSAVVMTFGIYSSNPDGRPHLLQWSNKASPLSQPNGVAIFAPVSFTFQKNTLYWLQFSVNTSTVFRAMSRNNSLNMGFSTAGVPLSQVIFNAFVNTRAASGFDNNYNYSSTATPNYDFDKTKRTALLAIPRVVFKAA